METPASDALFLEQLRSGQLPFEQWTHKSHIRLAYCTFLENQFDFESSLASIRNNIQFFNSKHTEKLKVGYHETMTRFWVHYVLSWVRSLPTPPPLFDEFWSLEGAVLGQSDAWKSFYSRELMFSEAAKKAFVPPDVCALPSIV